MTGISRKQNIFFQWIEWHFFDVPKNILLAWKNFLKFNMEYFSVPLLIRTLFSPWRRYLWTYPKGFDVWGTIETFSSNLFSRFMGIILRILLIITGLSIEVFILFAGTIIITVWMLLPVLLPVGLLFSLVVLS